MRRLGTIHWCMLALVWGLLIAAVLIPRLDRDYERITADSISYINSAENLLAGRGLKHVAWDCSTEPLVPLMHWPPGYPIAIAGLSRVSGLEPTNAALWIARAAWALLPFGSVVVFALIRRPGIGFAVGILTQLSPGALFAPMALTDGPFLLLAMISLACWGHALWLSGDKGKGGWRALSWTAGSGLAAGVAYTFRNVGVSLLVALPMAAVVWSVMIRNWRAGARLIVAFIVCAAPFVVALKIRSLMVFGSLEAYHMPRSTVSFFENIRHAIGSLVRDMTAAGEPIERMSSGNTLVLLFVTIPIGIVAFGMVARMWWAARAESARAAMILTLLMYAGAGIAVVVIGRTMYEWGEAINPRYMFQYSWILMGLLAAAAVELCELRPGFKPGLYTAGAIGMLALLGLHLRPWIRPSPHNAQVSRVVADEELRRVLATHAGSYLILSDQNQLLNQMGERQAFHIPLGELSAAKCIDAIPAERKTRPILVVIVKFLTPEWERLAGEASGDSRFRRVAKTPTAIAFETAGVSPLGASQEIKSPKTP